ncbi:acyl-CoA carboxylase epsilon subunit [Nocardiopsis sp. FIRDI 009]|uniref:acyl-CoA carboxylase epsilon subunit n=1 Tax=Nocardiopsis sp. FIRDI 009 TaxID=714197 RepID=UPI000E273FE2
MSEPTQTEEALVAENILILDILRGRPTPQEVRALTEALRSTIRAQQRRRSGAAGHASFTGPPVRCGPRRRPRRTGPGSG